MNIRLRYKIYTVLGILVGVFLWGRCSSERPSNVPSPFEVHQPTAVLPKNDREQITVDPVKHRLTILTANKNETLTLPDKPSVIDIHKDNTVQVTSPQFGFEHKFFFGIQASDALRCAVGGDLGYFKKLDLGIGFADEVGMHTPIAFVKVSYLLYDNLQIGLTMDNHKLIGGLVSVRL